MKHTLTIKSALHVAGVPAKFVTMYAPHLEELLPQYGVTDPLAVAHFLAQILHESGLLRYPREIWGPSKDQLNYERDFKKQWNDSQLAFRLGNQHTGDGKRFMGRGLIQVTGRDNYRRISKETGIDFLSVPTLLEQPRYAVLSALWYWNSRNITRIAAGDDEGTTEAAGGVYNTALVYVTKKINPGLRGLSERADLLARIKDVINITEVGA